MSGVRAAPGAERRRVTVRGTVQGVGFRPFVHRLATELVLTGFVHNDGTGVTAEVEGTTEAIEEFCRRLREQPPPLARLREIAHERVPFAGDRDFVIRPSDASADNHAPIPPDTATCAACLRELADPRDRRHRHPFITCTHCGPRFTIATRLPYDRATTTMADFPLCPACAAEYTDPADRRFHAQPVACPSCGPTLRLTSAAADGSGAALAGADALTEARRLLAHGAVLAVKGIGGYHLACDARNPAAVRALRARKERGGKPFAVMCADLTEARHLARISPDEKTALTSAAHPVVLLRRRAAPGTTGLADEVCPGSPDVGVMLPYTPLHQLLLGLPGDPPGPRTLVMTSGNVTGSPIVTDDVEARKALAGIADAWLWHDRPIESACDDSVVRVRTDGSVLVLRRSRGYVPAAVPLPVPVRPALAVGGDLKNTLCLASGHDAWFSPHLGDMADLATVRAAERAEDRMRALTGVEPQLYATDKHPGYLSARRARHRALGTRLLVRTVQHHHAHIASLMAEGGLPGTAPVLGVAFDGTGYGDDETVWGGEVLLADYDGFRRLAHLAPVALPGGDAGVGNPCRMALAQLRAAGIAWTVDLPCVTACPVSELRLLETQLRRSVACVPTSSMGRLFDAVSSLIGICHRAGYEAQAAIELEAAAVRAGIGADGAYTFRLRPGGGPEEPVVIDPAPVLHSIVADLRAGAPAPLIAMRFHRAVAAAVTEVCVAGRRDTGIDTVALTGGVFANALLDEECHRRLARAGFTVLRHGQVPPGDGGLALGQLMVAARQRPDDRP